MTNWVAEVADDERYVIHPGTLPTALDCIAKVCGDFGDHLVGNLVNVGAVVQVSLDKEREVMVHGVQGVCDGSMGVVEPVRHEEEEAPDRCDVERRMTDERLGCARFPRGSTAQEKRSFIH